MSESRAINDDQASSVCSVCVCMWGFVGLWVWGVHTRVCVCE